MFQNAIVITTTNGNNTKMVKSLLVLSFVFFSELTLYKKNVLRNYEFAEFEN